MLTSFIPTHKVGDWLLHFIDGLLDKIGLEHSATIETIIYIMIIVLLAIAIGWLVRRCVLFIAEKFVELHPTDTGNELLHQKVFSTCSHIIPPLVFLALIPFAVETENHTIIDVIEKVVLVYFLIMLAIGLNSILTFVWVHFDSHENTNKHPLRGLLNTGHGVVWIIIAITILSVIIGKSPGALLAGLGAFAAALMLIFKDSILGLVAGIQLSQNDMLRVGDWIVVTGTPANGTVIDVTLTTVKIRNWDNTTLMVPPYTLVSTSFQNWRGMFDMGARQIERCVYIDNSSIRKIEAAEVDRIAEELPLLKQFVAGRRELEQEGKPMPFDTDTVTVNGTLDTNLGLYRAYLCLYLKNHPQVSKKQYMIVRLRESTAYGTPLQICCYSLITKWVGYEALQSSIFEHVAATAPLFGLTIYNTPDRNRFEVGSPDGIPDESKLTSPVVQTGPSSDKTAGVAKVADGEAK